MIKVHHLTKSFNSHKVLDDLCFEISEGEIFVILGESGTGKSVLLKNLIGLIKPDKGSIEIGQLDITRLSERELLKARCKIGYLFQEGALYDFLTVAENVAFPLREHTRWDPRTIQDKVRSMLKMVDLEGVEDKYPAELSGGMKKRVALARAVILEAKILFCDEPTSGLDPIHSREISNLIQRISRQLKCTTVITSHDIPNAFRIADRLTILHEGRLVQIGSPHELKSMKDPFVQEFIQSAA